MINGAFAHNETIQNIIIVPNGKEGAKALDDKLAEHNTAAGIKGTLAVITHEVVEFDKVSEVVKKTIATLKDKSADYKKKRG